MASVSKYNITSLAAAVRPGVGALVSSQLEHLIDDAIAEIRGKLVASISTEIETRVEEVMSSRDSHVIVDCRVTIEDIK